MTTEAKKPNRLRRVLMWVGIVAFVLFVGIPTASILITRFRVSSAVRSAASIRLEEYSFPSSRTLTTRALTSDQFHRVTDALPLTADYGIPGMIAFCFVPHHRVIFTDRASRHEMTLDVCFGCEQVRLSDGSIQATPIAWQRPLRQLFLQHDIPVRDSYTPDFDADTQ